MLLFRATLAIVLSVAWLAGQTPCLFGLLLSLHGSHHAETVTRGDHVSLVFSNVAEEGEEGHGHGDHVVVISADKGVRERGLSASAKDPGCDPSALSRSRLLPATFAVADARLPAGPDHGPPPLGVGIRPLRL